METPSFPQGSQLPLPLRTRLPFPKPSPASAGRGPFAFELPALLAAFRHSAEERAQLFSGRVHFGPRSPEKAHENLQEGLGLWAQNCGYGRRGVQKLRILSFKKVFRFGALLHGWFGEAQPRRELGCRREEPQRPLEAWAEHYVVREPRAATGSAGSLV